MTQIPCYFDISKTYEFRQDLKLAWVEFLEKWTWDWFCTFTFRDLIHPEKADKLFRVWICKINRTLYGSRWYKHGKGIQWVRALEMQRRGVLHYHALIGGVGVQDLRRLTFMDEWDELAGFARITPVESANGVIGYVCKYVLKDGEIDLGGGLRDAPAPLFENSVRLATPEPDGDIPGQVKTCGGDPGQGLSPALGIPS